MKGRDEAIVLGYVLNHYMSRLNISDYSPIGCKTFKLESISINRIFTTKIWKYFWVIVLNLHFRIKWWLPHRQRKLIFDANPVACSSHLDNNIVRRSKIKVAARNAKTWLRPEAVIVTITTKRAAIDFARRRWWSKSTSQGEELCLTKRKTSCYHEQAEQNCELKANRHMLSKYLQYGLSLGSAIKKYLLIKLKCLITSS